MAEEEGLPSNFFFGNLDEGGGLDADWLDEVSSVWPCWSSS